MKKLINWLKSFSKRVEPRFNPTLDLTKEKWDAMPEAIRDNDVYIINTADGKYQIGEIYGAKNAQLVVHSTDLLDRMRTLISMSEELLSYSEGKVKNSIWIDVRHSVVMAKHAYKAAKGETRND